MKVIIEIDEDVQSSQFLKFIKTLSYVKIVKEFRDVKSKKIIHDLEQAFQDAKMHNKGKKRLTTAKEFLDEI
jgi:hypothetical protein